MAKYRINSGVFVYDGKNHKRGDIFECPINMLKRNLPGRPQRYTLVEGSADEPSSGGTVTATQEDPLGSMTAKELRGLAEDQGIDLGAAKSKAEVLAVLRDALD